MSTKDLVLIEYLETVDETLAFPVQHQIHKRRSSPSGSRYHLTNLEKEGVLERNEHKQLLPGPRFIQKLHSMGILDKWLRTKAGGLFMLYLGGQSTTWVETRVGIITNVKAGGAVVTWMPDEEGRTSQTKIKRSTLRRIWPVYVGDKLYATRYETKMYNFSKEKNG